MCRVNSEAYYAYVDDPAYAGQDADDPGLCRGGLRYITLI